MLQAGLFKKLLILGRSSTLVKLPTLILGCLIRIISETEGLFLDPLTGLYAYKITDQGTVEKAQLIRDLDGLVDFIFLDKKKQGFILCEDIQNPRIIQFNLQGGYSSFAQFEKQCKSILLGKGIRTDEGQNHLFVNREKKLLIYYEASNGMFSFSASIDQFNGSNIDDFLVFGSSHVIICCRNLHIYVVEVRMDKGVKFCHDIDSTIEGPERISCMVMDPLEKYLCITFEDIASTRLTNIILYTLETDGYPTFLDEINFYLDHEGSINRNALRSVSLELSTAGYPYLICYEYAGHFQMNAFWFNGESIIRYEPQKMHSDRVDMSYSYNGAVWSLDCNGILRVLTKVN